ncbi:hypothetical protein MAPG_08880 [Magnaporthiopsis poae ATCC 64411]|uniref:Amidohydrolase-related domain-containing protein n=1 Tax=Magnaporthiopsis poae (strain ATCC 64411 / 73-15) TaxID=644358 RepID=A0A0C4E8H3_MAGP6|nr:hypothetical protein MAPG_08880 [Magnaporthiopsis poae ATCC 64411]
MALATAAVQLPPMAWNCHMHSFDPAVHPFKPTRHYTPEPAPITAFLNNTVAQNAILVQATIEDGHAGLLDGLDQARVLAPDRTVLGIFCGALHRRSPGNLPAMRPIIEAFADAAPDALLWGSDWPHVNSSAVGLTPSPPLRGVDTQAELGLLREWLTDEQWERMLVVNPARAFGVDGK